MSILEKTIRDQPEALRAAAALAIDPASEVLDGRRRVRLIGTGTSEHAAALGAAMLELAGVDATCESAAGFVGRDREPGPDEALLVISHTGETAYARAARARALAAASPLVTITGIGAGWPEALEAAPRERSETYTAGYTATLVVLARIADSLGATGLGPDALDAAIEAAATEAETDWTGEPPRRLLVFVGAGPGLVTAREGALKVREAARIPAEGFEAEYLLHGSAALLDGRDRVVAVDPGSDDLLDRLVRVAAAAGSGVERISADAELPPLLRQLPLTVRVQKMAATMARARGVDPDRVIVGPWRDESLWSEPSAP